jgi:hypothetical protein
MHMRVSMYVSVCIAAYTHKYARTHKYAHLHNFLAYTCQLRTPILMKSKHHARVHAFAVV